MKYSTSLTSSIFGNILEWYDFGLFTIFSTLLSKLFFPTDNPRAAMLATVSIFAIGFFCRSIGALLFGYFGDRIGRATTMRWSILMISLPTFLIGVLPTFNQVGMLAPILLTMIRVCQGISIGGEYTGNIIYLAESAPKKHRAFMTAFASTGANIGMLLAALVGLFITSLCTTELLNSWGWRVPYLLSGILSIVIYIFRLKMRETKIFEELALKKKLANNPLKRMFKQYFPQLMRTVGMVCMGSTFYYFTFIYLPIFLEQNMKYSLHNISKLMTLFIFSMIILVPLAGSLCDKIGRRKMLLFNAAFIATVVIVGFYLLQIHSEVIAISVLGIFTLAASLEQGTTSIALVENFPASARYSGLSLGYNLGNGFLGGTIPFICEWLNANVSLSIAPAIYISACAVITLLVVFFFVPETKNIDLST